MLSSILQKLVCDVDHFYHQKITGKLVAISSLSPRMEIYIKSLNQVIIQSFRKLKNEFKQTTVDNLCLGRI